VTYKQWQQRWNIPDKAVQELREMLDQTTHLDTSAQNEQAVQNDLRLEASQHGARLWRNNVGAFKTDTGSWVRYGLCNDSTTVNKRIKSADLIGIRPITVGPHDVGRVIGQFVSREVKAPDWKYSPNDAHTEAQLRWAELISSLGGDACFVNGRGVI